MVDIVTRAGKGSPLTNNEVDANFTNLAEVSGITGEPMGHEDRTTSTISFNASTRTFTIAPVSTSFTVWCKGKKVVVSSAQTVTIPNTSGMYSIYFDANGALAAKAGYFTFSEEAPTAYIYWNAATGACPYFGDERHGVVLDWQTHEYLHRTRGAALASGFGASGYTLGGNGSSNAHAQLTLEGGTFFDEDMKIIVTATNTPTAGTWEQDLLSPARIPVLYLSGTGWVIDSPTDYPLKQGTARPQYNALSGGVWSTADVANNKYATSWILATNNLTYPVIAIIGQAESDLQSAAEAVDFTSLQLPGFPSVEFRPLYRLVFQCADSFSNAVKASLVSITDIRSIAAAGVAASLITDHGNLSGLSDDDHPQYLSVDTVRASLTAAVKASFLPSQTGNAGKFLTTDATSTSWAALTSGNITTALGFTPYNATNPAGYITGITSSDVTTALGFTPYNATNPSGFVTAAGARGAISVTGAGSYDSATGVINIVGGVTSFNTRTGAITLSSADVTTALGFTPYNSTNPNGYLTGITSTQVTTALGYTPYNSSNPSGYITGITSGMVTTALGFTPYNNSNPSGYITSSALSGYLTSASAASTYAPLTGTGASGTWAINITGTASGETLATVTARGGSTSSGVVLANTGNHYSGHFYYDAYDAGGNHYPHFQSGSNGTGATINWRVFNAAGSYITHYWDKNSTEFANNVRAPIFYDSNNTSYYGDFASTSQFNEATFAGYIGVGGVTPSARMSGTSGVSIYNASYPSVGFATASGPDYLIYRLGNAGPLTVWNATNGETAYFYTDYTRFYGSARAPIFYDSNDTGYYTDPNSTSVLNNINVAGTIQSTNGNGALRLYGNLHVDAYNGNDIYLNYYSSRAVRMYYGSYSLSFLANTDGIVYAYNQFRTPLIYDNNDTSYYVDPNSGSRLAHIFAGNVASSNDGSWNARMNLVGSSHARLDVVSNSDGIITTMYSHTGQGVGKIGTYSNHPLTLMAQGASDGGYVYSGSLRSPIFYDSNDTTYYVDSNNTSQFNLGRFKVPAYGGGSGVYSDDRMTLSVGNSGLGSIVYQSQYNSSSYPDYGMVFIHGASGGNRNVWSISPDGPARGDSLSFLYDLNSTNIHVGTTRFRLDGSGNSFSQSSSRAPIFYDSSNTAYYTDPTSTSRMDRLYVGNGAYAEIVLSDDESPNGIKYVHANGNNIGFLSGSGSWIFRVDNGGTGIAESSLRAPIFYDYNDTGYYFDGASTSRVNRIDFTNLYLASDTNYGFIGSSVYADTLNSGYAGDQLELNYVRGTWAGISHSSLRAPIFYDYNDTGTYINPNGGSVISSGGSYPMEFRSSQRYITRFWNQGASSYGWWLANDANSIVFHADSIGDKASLDTSGNFTATGSSRAPIFYDSENTGYYSNPNGGSQFNAVYLEGSGNNRAIGKTHSGSDFPNGTLVQTNIWAADWAGASFVMEVTGKSYSSSPPFSFMVQGYLYADTIINCSAINHGTPISYVKVFNYNNYLCFWWPRWGYWNSFEVRVRDAGGDSANRVTSITDSVLPSGSKMVEPGLFNTALYGYNQGGNLYASAYYDANNTAYYVDPNSGSRTGGINADSLYSYGNVTAYSDERLKKDWENLPANFVEELAKVKSGTYTRIDSGERQVGVGAQSLQSILKEAVSDKEQYLGVNYGNAALASAVELAKEVVDLRNRVAQLESLITKLIGD